MTLYEAAIEKIAPTYEEWKNEERKARTEVETAHRMGFSQGLVEALSLLFGMESWDVENDLINKNNE